MKSLQNSTYSSLAQSVERMTVNHDVAGSSPARGAKESLENLVFSRLFPCFAILFLGFYLRMIFQKNASTEKCVSKRCGWTCYVIAFISSENHGSFLSVKICLTHGLTHDGKTF